MYVGDTPRANYVFLEHLFAELDYSDQDTEEMLYVRDLVVDDADLSAQRRARLAARARLARNLSGSSFVFNKISELRHVCRMGGIVECVTS